VNVMSDVLVAILPDRGRRVPVHVVVMEREPAV